MGESLQKFRQFFTEADENKMGLLPSCKGAIVLS